VSPCKPTKLKPAWAIEAVGHEDAEEYCLHHKQHFHAKADGICPMELLLAVPPTANDVDLQNFDNSSMLLQEVDDTFGWQTINAFDPEWAVIPEVGADGGVRHVLNASRNAVTILLNGYMKTHCIRVVPIPTHTDALLFFRSVAQENVGGFFSDFRQRVEDDQGRTYKFCPIDGSHRLHVCLAFKKGEQVEIDTKDLPKGFTEEKLYAGKDLTDPKFCVPSALVMDPRMSACVRTVVGIQHNIMSEDGGTLTHWLHRVTQIGARFKQEHINQKTFNKYKPKKSEGEAAMEAWKAKYGNATTRVMKALAKWLHSEGTCSTYYQCYVSAEPVLDLLGADFRHWPLHPLLERQFFMDATVKGMSAVLKRLACQQIYRDIYTASTGGKNVLWIYQPHGSMLPPSLQQQFGGPWTAIKEDDQDMGLLIPSRAALTALELAYCTIVMNRMVMHQALMGKKYQKNSSGTEADKQKFLDSLQQAPVAHLEEQATDCKFPKPRKNKPNDDMSAKVRHIEESPLWNCWVAFRDRDPEAEEQQKEAKAKADDSDGDEDLGPEEDDAEGGEDEEEEDDGDAEKTKKKSKKELKKEKKLAKKQRKAEAEEEEKDAMKATITMTPAMLKKRQDSEAAQQTTATAKQARQKARKSTIHIRNMLDVSAAKGFTAEDKKTWKQNKGTVDGIFTSPPWGLLSGGTQSTIHTHAR
jgi:hypothetical protein